MNPGHYVSITLQVSLQQTYARVHRNLRKYLFELKICTGFTVGTLTY